jgi:hypothetical protein
LKSEPRKVIVVVTVHSTPEVDEMHARSTWSVTALAAVGALTVPAIAQARGGSDDPPNPERREHRVGNDDGPNHH